MRYLIQPIVGPPFFTWIFNTENHYAAGMIVYDLRYKKYTTDGKAWLDISEDHL